MSGAPVGVGIVGTGLSASQHLTALAQIADARVIAIAGTSAARAQAAAARWSVPRAVDDVAALVALPDVEVVHACTPPDTRLALVRLCAAHGKHILLEKPIARTVAEADELLRTATEAGIVVGAMFQNRFTPLARAAKAAIEQGKLGRLLLVTVIAKWFRAPEYYRGSSWRGSPQREGGAVLINQAIHAIDLVRWLVGPVDEVRGLTATVLHDIQSEDVGLAMLRFRGGALGSLVATTAAWPGFPDRLELHGERGSLTLLQGEGRLEWRLQGEEPRVDSASDQVSAGSSDPAATPSGGHVAQFRDLYSAIREGRPPSIDGREGRHALEIVEAIYRSNREGRPVRLPL